MNFTDNDIKNISATLESDAQPFDRGWSWKLHNTETKQSLVFSIYKDAQISNAHSGSLISVQTQHGYFELHDCTNFMLFEPDEVIFIEAGSEKLTSLIIGKQCSCSMYANISRDILETDFSELDPPVLLSAMQLSITEGII
jgi:hypothetical protein